MTRLDFVKAVNSYVSFHIPSTLYQEGWWGQLLNVDALGSGKLRNYGPTDIRLAVSWQIIMNLTGTSTHHAQLYRQAAHVMAAHTDGWVVLSEGQVKQMAIPTPSAFDKGAVFVPVPRWETNHAPNSSTN